MLEPKGLERGFPRTNAVLIMDRDVEEAEEKENGESPFQTMKWLTVLDYEYF